MSTKVQECFDYLEAYADENYCQQCVDTQPRWKEPFVKLEWAPKLLMHFYPPMYLDGAAAAASPIVHAFRNGELRYGHQGPWCIGTATWLLVEKGPVIVVGIDLDHAIQDAEQPLTMPKPLVDKMLSLAGRDPAEFVNRVRFRVYAASGSALWVPHRTTLALCGIAEGGTSAVVVCPWFLRGAQN